AVLPDHRAAELLRQDPRSLGRRVGEDRGVPLWQEADRRRRLAVGQRSPREIEEFASTLVAKRPQLQLLETGTKISHADAREAEKILLRRRPERREMAFDDSLRSLFTVREVDAEPGLHAEESRRAPEPPSSARREMQERREYARSPAAAHLFRCERFKLFVRQRLLRRRMHLA